MRSRNVRSWSWRGKLLICAVAAWLTAQSPVNAQIVYTPAGGGGASLSGNNTWTGTQTFIDNAFLVVDDGDNTKKIAFQASGITTGTTRTYTMPNADGTLPLLGLSNTFTGSFQTVVHGGTATNLGGFWSASAAAGTEGAGWLRSTTQTPDSGLATVGSLSNTLHILESADRTFDFQNCGAGTAAATNPQLCVHDKDQNTTNYQSLGLSGTSGKFVVTLTETVATSVVIIPVAADSSVSGMLLYTVHAKDATNSQTRSGRVLYNGVAEGVTATCVIGTPEELDNTPTGTLTATITCTSPANNQIQLLIDATSSLTQTTLEAYGQIQHVGAGEPLPQ